MIKQPTDNNDLALLLMAEGSTFNDATLPSGFKTPPVDMQAKGGILVFALANPSEPK